MDAAEFPDALAYLVERMRETDSAFADALAKGGTDPERVRAHVAAWSAEYGKREPYWVYSQFSIAASHALEDGVEALGVDTEAAFVAYAKSIPELAKTPEEHHAALEKVRDVKRAEAFAALVTRVEALGARAGLRVRHAGLTRALERCVPNPDFTTKYGQVASNPGDAVTAGALVGTAMMPIVGTVIGGAAGWLGERLLHGKAPEPDLEKQKAKIVYAAGQLRDAIVGASGDASELASEQLPYVGAPVSPDKDFRMLGLYSAIAKFFPEDEE